MSKLNEFFEVFDTVVNTMNDQDILCNGVIGALLHDHKNFNPTQRNYKTFSKPRFHGGEPFIIGYIDNSGIYVDPYLLYTDFTVSKGNGKLLYNFEKFKPAELI